MNWDIVRDKEQAGSTYQDVHSPLSRLHQARLNDSFIQLTSLCAGAWRADGETRERTVKSKIQYFWHKSGDTDDVYIGFGTLSHRGTAVAQWLRYYATNRKVADSIPDGVIGNFHWHNPSDRTMVPGVDSVSNRNQYQDYFVWGKRGRCVRLTTLPPS